MRIPIVCPEALVAGANHLAMALVCSEADGVPLARKQPFGCA
jgi:hypothetical protein